MGDGDQSSFSIANESSAQFHRELWACGGDLIFQGQEGEYFTPFAQLCISGSYPELVAHLASVEDDKEQIKALLETRHCILRQTALVLAIVGAVNSYAASLYNRRADHVAVVKLLLSHGARTDARDLCGKTAIHYCTSRLCLPNDPRLLEMGDLIFEASKTQNVNPPLVDFPDRFGNVALHDTVMAARLDLVRYLVVKHGADPTIADITVSRR
jgi:ankyrin repeat protein